MIPSAHEKFEKVKLCTVSSLSKAQIISAKLEAFGIHSVVESDDVGGLEAHFQLSRGVAVFVEKEELIAAKQLIED